MATHRRTHASGTPARLFRPLRNYPTMEVVAIGAVMAAVIFHQVDSRVDYKVDRLKKDIDVKLTAMDTKMDIKFAGAEKLLDVKLITFDMKMDLKFAAVDARFDRLEKKMDAFLGQSFPREDLDEDLDRPSALDGHKIKIAELMQ